jgi:hypothetical protein
MFGTGSILILAAVLLMAVFILVLPLQLAAHAMGAKRYGVGACLLSLIAASFMQMVGFSVPVYGTIIAFLLSSAAFAGILGTDFLRGIGISILHIVFSFLLLFFAAMLLGLSFSALMCM